MSEQDLQLPLTECYSGFCNNCTASVSEHIHTHASVCVQVCDHGHKQWTKIEWCWLASI